MLILQVTVKDQKSKNNNPISTFKYKDGSINREEKGDKRHEIFEKNQNVY